MKLNDQGLRYWFGDNEIAIACYPYVPASVYPNKRISYDCIREVLVETLPLEMRTQRGEVLLVPAADREALIAAAQHHRIPAVRRVDVWGLVLEPFVDTKFNDKRDAETRTKLNDTGVDYETCMSMRRRLEKIVASWNLGLARNWWGLSLFNAFDAIQHTRDIQYARAMNDAEYEAFYWEAMALAERGRLLSTSG